MARTLTGNNRRREQRLQELMAERVSQQFERRIAREIARAMRAAATALANGRISPADQIREKHQARIERLLANMYRASMLGMAEHMTGTQRSWRGNIETKNLDEVEPTDVTDRLMQRWMADVGARKITQITTTTQADIRRIINRGMRDGLSEREIGTLIRQQAPAKSASRAQTIARTEVHSASQASAQAVAEASGLEMVRVWVSSRGERTRTIADGAQFDHLAADGQTVAMNEPFVIEGIMGDEELMYPGDPMGSAGNIINCFDGDVRVAFDSCKKSIRSVYSGELVTIKTSTGHKLTGTPNHPIMTDRGLVPLGMINHSSNLICCPMNRNIADGFDVENVPTTFKKLHDTLSVIGVRVGVSAIPVNLYGRVPDRQVDVIRAERMLRNGVKTSGLKGRLEFRLKMPNLRERFGLCLSLLNRVGGMKFFRSFSNSFVGCRNLCRPLFHAHSGPLQRFRLALASDMSTTAFKYSPNGASATAESLSDGILASPRIIKADDHGLIKRASPASGFYPGRFKNGVNVAIADTHNSSNLIPSLSRHIHLDNPVEIYVRRVFNHKVYTLETEEGLYNAGGIISGNCRCAVVYELQ